MRGGRWQILFLTVAAFATRFAFLTYPSEVVFDETHFGTFVSAYFTHEYYFDIHPPLGKVLIAAFAWLFGFRGGETFAHIGDAVHPHALFALRFLPALFGALVVPLLFAFIVAVSGSRRAALIGSSFVLFDNAFLVQSRFTLLDLTLVFFGILALTLAAHAFRSPLRSFRRLALFSLAAIASACAFSVKWTGLSFLGLIAVAYGVDVLRRRDVRELLLVAAIFLLIPAFFYLAIFALHFALLTHPGPGDAFMSASFQAGLSGKGVPPTFLEKFVELNRVMWSSSAYLRATHPYGSRWYEWPFMVKPIWYWTKTEETSTANIFFVGNPMVWWSAAASLLVLAFGYAFRKPWVRALPEVTPMLLLGYAANLLPFLFITRVSFLYHYLPALVFGIVIASFLCDRFLSLLPNASRLTVVLISIVGFVFLAIAPLTYGIPLPPSFASFLFRLVS